MGCFLWNLRGSLVGYGGIWRQFSPRRRSVVRMVSATSGPVFLGTLDGVAEEDGVAGAVAAPGPGGRVVGINAQMAVGRSRRRRTGPRGSCGSGAWYIPSPSASPQASGCASTTPSGAPARHPRPQRWGTAARLSTRARRGVAAREAERSAVLGRCSPPASSMAPRYRPVVEQLIVARRSVSGLAPLCRAKRLKRREKKPGTRTLGKGR